MSPYFAFGIWEILSHCRKVREQYYAGRQDFWENKRKSKKE